MEDNARMGLLLDETLCDTNNINFRSCYCTDIYNER